MKKKSCSIVHTNNETNLLCFNSFINLLILEAWLDVVKVGWYKANYFAFVLLLRDKYIIFDNREIVDT
jgi:hypothetical protein